MDREADMKTLADAAGDLTLELRGDPTTRISGLNVDSRKHPSGDLFFCVRGSVTDGHKHAPAAVEAGAAALCVERPLGFGVPEVVVSDARRAMPHMAAAFLDRPADDLLVL